MIYARMRLGALVVVVAAVVSACGGSSPSGLAAEPASYILAAAKAAGVAASSVKLTATADVSGTQESYALQEEDPSHYEESEARAGQRFTKLRLGEDVYVIGNPAFLAAQGASPARQTQFNDKWLMGTVAPISAPPGLRMVMDSLLNPQGPITKGATSTVDGQSVVAVFDAKVEGTLYVATKGTPYPVELTRRSPSVTSRIKFSDWNQPLALTPPASYHSLSLLRGGG